MSLTTARQRTRTAGPKAPALLLIATLAAFVVYVTFAVATISKEVETSADVGTPLRGVEVRVVTAGR